MSAACNTHNGTYTCQRRIGHRGEHASVSTYAGTGYVLRWGGPRGDYSQGITRVLERAFESEED